MDTKTERLPQRSFGVSSGDYAAIARRVRRTIGVAPVLVLVVAAVWEIAVIAGIDEPGPEQWRDAGEFVRKSFVSGDRILFTPEWTEPLGRRELGDLMPLPSVGAMDNEPYGTIWEVARAGHQTADLPGAKELGRWSFGDLTVRNYQQEPVVVVTDFLSRLNEARTIGRVHAPRLEEVGFRPRWCAKVVPAVSRDVEMVWEQADLGDELVGYVGVADVFTRRDVREPGRISLWLAGRESMSMSVGVDDGWKRFSVAVAKPVASLRLVFSTDVPGRNLCFALQGRMR